jgi:hypothetical protein
MTRNDTTALPDTTARPQTARAAGELRQLLRERGWRADLAWAEVGSRSASGAVTAAGGADVRRTIAYLPSLRALDGGTLRLWRDGDVPVPAAADVREVMVATAGAEDWHSETFEAPAARVERDAAARPAGIAA